MRGTGWLAGWAIAACAGWACTGASLFYCDDSSQCQQGGVEGACQPGGLCSFPDDGCPSGQRYGDLAGSASGECVSPSAGTDTTSADGGPGVTASATSGVSTSDGSAETTVNVSGGSSSDGGGVTSLTTDPTETTSSDTGAGSSSDGVGTTGPGPGPDPYGTCRRDQECPVSDCVTFGVGGSSACVPLCDNEPCPPHPDGFPVACDNAGGGDPQCIIECDVDVGGGCPAGFECVPHGPPAMGRCAPQ